MQPRATSPKPAFRTEAPISSSSRLGLPPGHSLQRLILRGALLITGFLVLRAFFFPSPPVSEEIQSHGVFERVLATDKYLDVTKYPFLQSRMGRDERPDLFDLEVNEGILDFWTRFQKPFITSRDTAHLDTQVMRTVVDDLLQFNGWVAAACPTLIRPFRTNSKDDNYEDLASKDNLYYIAITIHSADHFLVDQLAIIVQLARRLGTRNLFVSMLDMDSIDSTPTLSDLCEAILTILGIAFRIRRVPPMTVDPSAAYYPAEEAFTRNLALEPLQELWKRRSIKFHRVIWLKGFTCPNDVLESLRVSEVNNAAMVCGMDWAEHNGFFIFSDRWRTRDIEGNLFRQAKSNAKPEAGPPRDASGTDRYKGHLPLQVFCCESGTHVVDPEQSYYKEILYRSSPLAHNLSSTKEQPNWDPETQCMDSTQMWFCRDLWTDAARGGLKEGKRGGHLNFANPRGHKKRDLGPLERGLEILGLTERGYEEEAPVAIEETEEGPKAVIQEKKFEKRQMGGRKKKAPATVEEEETGDEVKKINKEVDEDLDVTDSTTPDEADEKKKKRQMGGQNQAPPTADDEQGTDVDAMEESTEPPPEAFSPLPASAYLIPNSAFTPARILVNPRCVTTYGGVSHTQLALDLFGGRDEPQHMTGNYVLEDWQGPPDSFVCQEMRTTGGRTAAKSQRRVGFLLQNEVGM